MVLDTARVPAEQMSDDEADAVGAAEADAYAAEFADDDYVAVAPAPIAATTGKRPREEEAAAAPVKGAWCLIVKMKFDDAKKIETLKEIFSSLARYIKANEPTTLAYELMLSDKDPLVATIFERYADKEKAYLEIHRSSKPFERFRPKLAALAPEMDGHSYYEHGTAGFMQR